MNSKIFFLLCMGCGTLIGTESFVVQKKSSTSHAAVLRDEIIGSYGEIARSSSRLIQSLAGVTEALVSRTTDVANGTSCAVHNANIDSLERYKQALDECERILQETYAYVTCFEASLKADKKLVVCTVPYSVQAVKKNNNKKN